MKKNQWVLLVIAIAIIVLVIVVAVRLVLRQPDEVRVGYMRIAAHLPVIAADKLGIFEENRLKVSLELYSDTPSLMKAVETGRVDVGYQVTPDFAWKSASTGKRYEIYFVAQSTEDAPIDGLYSLTKLNADSLRNKVVGCFPGPTAKAMTKRIIKIAFGLDTTKYELREVPPPLQLSLLTSGEIKALFTYEPLGTLAMERSGAKQIIKGPVEKYIVNPWNGGIGIFTENFVNQRRDVACGFQRAIFQTVKSLNRNPNLAAKFMVDLMPGMDRTTASKVPVTEYVFSYDETLGSEENLNLREGIQERLDTQLEIYKSLGILSGEGRYNLRIFEGCK